MHQHRFSAASLVCLAALVTGCTDAPLAPQGALPEGVARGVVPVIPLGDDPGRSVHTCRSGSFRQFDFWLGDWDVSSLGTPAGTNRVRSEVDGCVVAEYWDSNGVPGWSMNMFDPETMSWHQHWVDATGVNLFLSGGLQGDAMVITGARRTATGRTVIDRITYTPLAGGTMRQYWDASTDGGQTFSFISFDGLYTPKPVVRPEPELSLSSCSTAAFHGVDFLLGEWAIRTGDGAYVGKTEFSPELSHCLIQQTAKGRAGYESKAFLSYGRVAAMWRLTHTGSDGERLFLEGTAGAGSLVLQGSEMDSGVNYLVRLTYTAVDNDRLTQRWERSADNGSTWEQLAELDLTRH